MMISLDEAILHCQERAAADCSECAREHLQLAEWLEELKSLREKRIPKKPGIENGHRYCNACGKILAKRYYAYCPHCGQRVKKRFRN